MTRHLSECAKTHQKRPTNGRQHKSKEAYERAPTHMKKHLSKCANTCQKRRIQGQQQIWKVICTRSYQKRPVKEHSTHCNPLQHTATRKWSVQDSSTSIKRDLLKSDNKCEQGPIKELQHVSKETYSRAPTHMKRDLYKSTNTYEKWSIHGRQHMSKETYTRAPTNMKRDLLKSDKNVKRDLLKSANTCQKRPIQEHQNIWKETYTKAPTHMKSALCKRLQCVALCCSVLQWVKCDFVIRLALYKSASTYQTGLMTKSHSTHCNPLQHTATHCNTHPWHMSNENYDKVTLNPLQHTATHCNTLQHTATHCNTHSCQMRHMSNETYDKAPPNMKRDL